MLGRPPLCGSFATARTRVRASAATLSGCETVFSPRPHFHKRLIRSAPVENSSNFPITGELHAPIAPLSSYC
jgi:hypothetical protein